MNNSTSNTFDEAVAKFFAPIVSRANLAIRKLGQGVYEVQSPEFTMRIRRGSGHRKDILVTLLPTAERPSDIRDLSKEIGFGVIANFHGEKLAELPFDTEDDYFRYASSLATAAEKFLLPYPLGLRTDFLEIKDFVKANVDKALSEMPKYRFPKNVRKEWT